MKDVKITFASPAGKLAGVLHHPPGSCRGCIITSHGLFSSKDSDKFLALGNYFAEKGFFVFRFDYRGCGESEGFIEDTTISGRKKDLTAALSFIQKTILLDAHTVGLLGSSMGGYISLLVAPDWAPVKAVVTWATPFSFSGLWSVI
jgi:alpha/beta superfamily hydrolase